MVTRATSQTSTPKVLPLVVSFWIGITGCATSTSLDRPTVVVTYSVLGDVIAQLVGDAADVQVMIPNGTDPHEFEPSAKDVETMNNAVLIIANGANLEEQLDHIIDEAQRNGVPVFVMADHVTTRTMTEDGAEITDPHLWLDPMTIHQAIPDLTQKLGMILNVDLTKRSVVVQQDLADMNSEAAAIMRGIENCTLVTGHDEMGYFAARYGCTVVGAIIPSLSTSAEASAGQIAELKQLVSDSGVHAIFASLGTPTRVAEQLARELDVQLVELSTHRLGKGDHYREFILRISQQVADALN